MTSGATLLVRVARIALEAIDIRSFEVVRSDGGALPAFSAGSHVDVLLPNGLTRQYSLCNDPAETHRYLIAVLRDPASRGGSQGMHEQVQEGQLLQISAPKNHFALAPKGSRSLLLAGGIGVTPILSMAERLTATGAEFEMHYSNRSRARTAFFDQISASAFAPRVRFHFDDGDASQKLDLAALFRPAGVDVHVYVCGPKGFMDAVLAAASAQQWPQSQLHYESFGAEVTVSASDASFQVKLARSGRVITVPSGQTVTQTLSAAGVDVQTACEQGVCGTCLTRVLEGIPDHKDQYLTPEEAAANDQFTPCCSRAMSPLLVLDL